MREIAVLLQLLAMGQIYHFTLSDGRAYSIGVEITNYSGGQMDGYVQAWISERNGSETKLGYIDFSIWRDVTHIKYIEVSPEYRRESVGRNLMQVLRKEIQHPIDPGYATDEGAPFVDRLNQENPDWFVQPDPELEDA